MEISIATNNSRAVESGMVESVMPDHFETNAKDMIKLLKAYYRYLNTALAPTYELNNMIREHDVDLASDKYLDAIERMVASNIPQSQSLDRRRLFKIIADYYNSRGSEDSVYAFFRIFYNEFITLTYPKELLFTPSDANKGLLSDKNRVRDSYRWQEYSYKITNQTDTTNWRDEYLKFVHPAGLKFFVALTLELFAQNDWDSNPLISYLTLDGLVEFAEDLPETANDGDLYLVTIGKTDDISNLIFDGNNLTYDGLTLIYQGEPILYGDRPNIFRYDDASPVGSWTLVGPAEQYANYIDWSKYFGMHTPKNQFISSQYTYLFKVLLGDGGKHYLTHIRGIHDKKGMYKVDRDLLKAFYHLFIISYQMVNDNTINTNFRSTWNKRGKFIDSGEWSGFGNMTILEGDTEYTKASFGGITYISQNSPEEFKTNYKTQFNTFCVDNLQDSFTLSYQVADLPISQFDFILDPDASPIVIETFVKTSEYHYESSDSDLIFAWEDGIWKFGKELTAGNPTFDVIYLESNDRSANHLSPALWEIADWYRTPQCTDNIATIVDTNRFINLVFEDTWTDDTSPFESDSYISGFLSYEDDSPYNGYAYDTQSNFNNSFVFTYD